MEREQRRRNEGAADAHPAEHEREKNRVGHVEGHVDQVVAERVESPELVVDPKARVEHGIVLRRVAGVQPDPRKTARVAKRRVPFDVQGIVPEKLACHRRPVGPGDRNDDRAEGDRMGATPRHDGPF